jgi:hypothetical protein
VHIHVHHRCTNVGASLLAIGPAAIHRSIAYMANLPTTYLQQSRLAPHSTSAFPIAAVLENLAWRSSCRTIFTLSDEMQLTVIF